MSWELNRIKEIPLFSDCMKKLTISSTELSSKEKTFILTVAALLIKKYSLDKRHVGYAELAYYIVLNYSLIFNDYLPLYDFSISFGIYPISYALTKNGFLSFESLANSLIESRIEREYKNHGIIETFEQKKFASEILTSECSEESFIAPTSFGKSSLILAHLQSAFNSAKKYAIVVPSKALLMQTYRNVKALSLPIRIITHDEMYEEGLQGFVGVFTQERAFRLLNKYNISYDFMYIDEAHQLLECDSRSILLSRLIKLNKKKFADCKVLYFSPLVSDSSNLILQNGQSIAENRIRFNVKEPKIYEYLPEKCKRIYNRFIDDFIPLETSANNIFEYVDENKGEKNFVYLYTPKKIQKFARAYLERRERVVDSEAIDEIVLNLNRYVHQHFYLTDCIKKGFLYLHGKLPDSVKDYLLVKFSQISELSTVIANKVILEGMNLPIDTLFILDGNNLNQAALTNLVGRVNRLNEIFSDPINLEKLQPSIHFVNSNEYNRMDGRLENKIKLLKKTNFIDELENPLLQNYEMPSDVNDRQKAEKIQREDCLFFTDSSSEVGKLKKKVIELGLNNIYKDVDVVSQLLFNNFTQHIFNELPEGVRSLPVMERFCFLFISGMEKYIIDDEVVRLRNPEAIAYYEMFLENRKISLNEKISREVAYFRRRIESGNAYLYIGRSFGEIPYPWDSHSRSPVYVDLSLKSDRDLINLAIIKQKQEEDFVSFKLLMFFQLMLDYDLMTKEEYEQILYGSNNQMDIRLVKQGLPINLAAKIRNDGQIDNIYIDENGNIQCNEEFITYKNSLDDFLRFQIDRII